MTVNVALDAMGGDRGPDELVLGALHAVQESDHEVTLLGDEQHIKNILNNHTWDKQRIHVVHTSQVISMRESPFDAVRKKKDASIVVAFDLLKKKKVDAVVSAGNSGATMAAAIKYLGRLKNISRPGIASLFPTLKGPVVMMDVSCECRLSSPTSFSIWYHGGSFFKSDVWKRTSSDWLIEYWRRGWKG